MELETATATQDDDLAWLDATAQAQLVRSGQVSGRELVDAAIARIERLDPTINAMISERFERARAEADSKSGPFAGVPIVLKDLGGPSEGDPLHMGNKALADAGFTAPADGGNISRLRAAGFVPLGRTNVPEFGLHGSSENLPYGKTRNPWHIERTPGGSSGGSAAAVAAGMVSIATGGDAGGSLRMPASHCHLVTLKPSRGRVSAAPEGDPLFGHAVPGVLARSVRDVAASMDVMAINLPGDPVIPPALPRPLAEEVGRDPGRLRIGFLDAPANEHLIEDEQCKEAVHIAARTLESLGHSVEESSPDAMREVEYIDHFLNVLSPGIVNLMNLIKRITGRFPTDDELSPVTVFWRNYGEKLSAAELEVTLMWLDGFRRRMAEWWASGFDILLTPNSIYPAPPLGYFWDGDGIQASLDGIAFTPQFNSTGQPAVSVPIRVTEDHIPVGVQLVAAYGREDQLIQLAAQLEAARPWVNAAARPSANGI